MARISTLVPDGRSSRRDHLGEADLWIRPSERQAGRPSLIATSRKPNTRSGPEARRPRAGFHTPSGSGLRAVVDGRRIRTVLVGLGLGALMGATTWAVASVSIWLVPVYLLLMVLIFATPRAERAGSKSEGSRAKHFVVEADEVGRDPGEDRAVEMGETRPADEPVLETPAVETADATMPNPDPTSTGAAKPRRSRARYRKTAKTAAEPVTDATPATWIRVGPGKFVRADASVPFPVQAQSEEIAVAAYPATDTSESATAPSEIVADGRPETDGPETAIVMDSHPATDGPAPPAPTPEEAAPVADVPTVANQAATTATEVLMDASPVTDALEAVAPDPSQPVPFEVPADPGLCATSVGSLVSSEPTPDEQETAPPFVEELSGSDAEEYGIAPSAFGPITADLSPVESLDHGVLAELDTPECDRDGDHELGGQPPDRVAVPSRLGARRQRSCVRGALLSRLEQALVTRGHDSDSTSSRRRGQSRPVARAVVRRGFLSDHLLRRSARRAYDRTDHAQRICRSRSPPRPPG